MPIIINNPQGGYYYLTGSVTTTTLTSSYNSNSIGTYAPESTNNFTLLSGSSLTGAFSRSTYIWANIVSGSYLSGSLDVFCYISGTIINGGIISSWNNEDMEYTVPWYGHHLVGYVTSSNLIFGGYVYNPNYDEAGKQEMIITASFLTTSSISGTSSLNTTIISGSHYSSSISYSYYSASTSTEIHSHNSNINYLDMRDYPYLSTVDIKNCVSFSSLVLSSNAVDTRITFSGNSEFNYLDLSNVNVTTSIESWVHAIYSQMIENSASSYIRRFSPPVTPTGVVLSQGSGLMYFANSINTSIIEEMIANNPSFAAEWSSLYNTYNWGQFRDYPIHPMTLNWASRVVANGGNYPNNRTISAISYFCWGLEYYSNKTLFNKMKVVNCFVPDNLIACLTPLINSSSCGYNPWINTNFVAGDLNINGLKGNGENKSLNTGFGAASASMRLTSIGLTMYNSFYSTGSIYHADGELYIRDSSDSRLELNASNYGVAKFYAGSDTSLVSGTALSGGLGFTSGNRINNTASLYVASSTVPFKTIGTASMTTGVGTTPRNPIIAFRGYSYQPYYHSSKRISFIAIHEGLNSTETEKLYNLVKAMRMQMGGGYV